MRTFEERFTKRELFLAGVFCLGFIVCQIFQKWVFITVPLAGDSLGELQSLGHPLHIARSLGVLLSIALLMVPFTLMSQFGSTPMMRTLILVFFSFFVLFEIGYRSVELFVIQLQWAPMARSVAMPEALLARFELFNEVTRAIYFPLLLSHGIASGLAGVSVPFHGIDRLLKGVLLLNALRLALRIGGMFAGIGWMNTVTGTYYFPFILTIFIPITAWCFLRSRSSR